MQVYKNIQDLPSFTNAVLTVGTFDGVHRGHQQVLQLLLRQAIAIGGDAVVITFHPHPRRVVAPVNPSSAVVQLLTTASEKYQLLSQFGIQHVVEVPFDESFSRLSAAEYVSGFLVEKFHPHTIIIGYDHKFGSDRRGDYHLLENMGAHYGFQVKEIPGHMLRDITVSSTKIRQALLSGDVETAGLYLGYHYFFEGRVIKGNQLGRTIGFPTANISIGDEDKLVPANAVYAVQVLRLQTGVTYNAMMNIGTRPTVGGQQRSIEVNIFDFNEMIYGEMLRVKMLYRIRSEEKFSSPDALKIQLGKDKAAARQLLSKPASF